MNIKLKDAWEKDKYKCEITDILDGFSLSRITHRYSHYILDTRNEFNGNDLLIRIPGRTIGIIGLDYNNKITNIVIDDTISWRYDIDIKEKLKKFIGEEFTTINRNDQDIYVTIKMAPVDEIDKFGNSLLPEDVFFKILESEHVAELMDSNAFYVRYTHNLNTIEEFTSVKPEEIIGVPVYIDKYEITIKVTNKELFDMAKEEMGNNIKICMDFLCDKTYNEKLGCWVIGSNPIPKLICFNLTNYPD